MASFVLSFSPLDVLDEIWDLIESVSEGFLTYSSVTSCLLSRRWRPFQGLYSYNIKFALGIEPSDKKGKNGTDRVASPKYVIMHLMVIRHIAMPFFILFSPFYKEEQL